MAVTNVNEIFQGRDGDTDTDTRKYTRVFRVITNSRADEAATVRAAVASSAGVFVGSTYPFDSTSWCQRVSPRNEAFSPFVWIVTASYSSQRERSENPLNDPPEISWSTEQFQKIAIEDEDNEAVLNSAGDPFDPPDQMDDSRRVVTVSRNLAAVPSWILSYQDAVNSDEFTIDGIVVAIGLAKVQRVSVSRVQNRNDIQFRNVAIEIHIQRDGWTRRILDQGFRYIKDGKPVTIAFDEDGNLVAPNVEGAVEPTQPVLLNGSGAILASPTPSTAVFLEYDVYKKLPFSALPL